MDFGLIAGKLMAGVVLTLLVTIPLAVWKIVDLLIWVWGLL